MDSDNNESIIFHVQSPLEAAGARVGSLTVHNQQTIKTPHYIAISSRGCVPHVTQDNLCRRTGVCGMHVALEDFIEKHPRSIPPILSQDLPEDVSPLRQFIAAPHNQLLVLGPRRHPPVASPFPNSDAGLSIYTVVGFSTLSVTDYVDMAQKMRPDIVIGLADVAHGTTSGRRRCEKSSLRTCNWVKYSTDKRKDSLSMATGRHRPAFFAPVLPVPAEAQSRYLSTLADELKDDIDGLAFYDSSIIVDLPPALRHLPRLSLTEPSGPQQVLRDVALGVDIFTLPFISAATDAGIALDFGFPVPADEQIATKRRPLGTDMWSTAHSTSLQPLSARCACYACSNHHQAYIQHLLNAKEMLAWVLLQIHNLQTIDSFFAGVRHSLANNTFGTDVEKFESTYEPQLPVTTGQGPRIRGYQYSSQGPGEPKRNAKAFGILNNVTSADSKLDC